MTLYGFRTANAQDEPAWFHTRPAARRFAQACGWEEPIRITEILAHECDPRDILDTPGDPWRKA